jgi:arylsulfatase A-like enzyme
MVFLKILWVLVALESLVAASIRRSKATGGVPTKQPNILLMLADDLGYGDLSVPPFVGGKVHSPALEAMAREGAIMTNFHAAAPICSPSRASIMTGLFSWRVGIAGVYEYGKKDGKSNRNDWYEEYFSFYNASVDFK